MNSLSGGSVGHRAKYFSALYEKAEQLHKRGGHCLSESEKVMELAESTDTFTTARLQATKAATVEKSGGLGYPDPRHATYMSMEPKMRRPG